MNLRTKKTYRFFCFHDRDLGLPKVHAEKTITHVFIIFESM